MELHKFFHINTYNYPDQLTNAKGRLYEVKPRGKVFYRKGINLSKDIKTNLHYSKRKYIKKKMSFSNLEKLLHNAYYIEDFGNVLHGTVPSAGGLFPLEVYIMALNVENLERGIYHFDKVAGILTPVRFFNKIDLKRYFPNINNFISTAPVVLFLTCDFENVVKKYGPRGYRYAYIEAGHVGQNIRNLCAKTDMGSCPVGAFFDEAINNLLHLEEGDFAIYAYTFGERDI